MSLAFQLPDPSWDDTSDWTMDMVRNYEIWLDRRRIKRVDATKKDKLKFLKSYFGLPHYNRYFKIHEKEI